MKKSLFALALCAACNPSPQAPSASKTSVIVIGQLIDRTGSIATPSWGESIRLAVSDANQALKQSGKTVRFEIAEANSGNSPDMARAFNSVGGFIRFNSKLDPRLRELAILQVGWLEKSEYEFTHHVKIGREFGVTDDDIAGLMAETEGKPSKLEPLAKTILRGAREMVRELAMSEATFAEIKKELSDEQMVDLVLTIAFYCAVVRVLATMKIDNESYYKEVLQQYPIPGVE